MPGPEDSSINPWALSQLLGQRSILGLGVLTIWLVLFHLFVNAWLLCMFTSLLVVLGGWLGSQAALDTNSLLHLEHFLPLREATPLHTPLENERRLDWEIHSAVDKAIRDFVSSWYRALVCEEGGEFEQEARYAMLAAAAELKRRAQRVDRHVVAQRVLEMCGCHLQSYSDARERQRQAQAVSSQQGGQEDGSSCPSLWTLYSEAVSPHPALASDTAELCYARAVVDLLLHVLVPYPHLETRTGRYMVGELITCNVLMPLVSRVSNPDWLNLTIVDVFTRLTRSDDITEDLQVPQTPPAGPQQALQDPWRCDSTPSWDWQDASSVQTGISASASASVHDSSESRLLTPYSSEESVQVGCTGQFDMDRPGGGPTPTPRSPYRTSRFYRHQDLDLELPLSEPLTLLTESLDQSDSDEDKSENFCDCVSTTDFCGRVCLEEDSLGLLQRRSHPKVLISEPPSWLESPVEDEGGNSHAPVLDAGSLCLKPFGFEPLLSQETPVVVQNVHISGTVSAKEQKGCNAYPYTLYTIKYETTVDADGPGSEQQVAFHVVNRRYSEFVHLQTRLEERPDLKKVIKNVKGPKRLFPDLPFGNPETDKVEARKGLLESFVKKLCTIPEAANSEEVQEFLALNTDASTAFERKPCGSRIDKMMENIVDTLKTAFPRSEAQSPTEEAQPDTDGRTAQDSKRNRSRLRFSSKITPTLNVPDLQPKVVYCFSKGSTVFNGLVVSGMEGFVRQQEKLLDGTPTSDPEEVQEGRRTSLGERGEDTTPSRPPERRSRVTDTVLADVALNILCLLMKDQWSWLCTENIQKTIRLLFGTFIERWLDVGIAHLTSAPCWVLYLRVLQDAVWPGGELQAEPQQDRSPEQREEARQQCLHCLMTLLPEFLSEMLGLDKYRESWELVQGSVQDPYINRHLVYCIFDLLLEFLVPEFSEEAFQKSLLFSLSKDMERTSASA